VQNDSTKYSGFRLDGKLEIIVSGLMNINFIQFNSKFNPVPIEFVRQWSLFLPLTNGQGAILHLASEIENWGAVPHVTVFFTLNNFWYTNTSRSTADKELYPNNPNYVFPTFVGNSLLGISSWRNDIVKY